MSTIVSTFFKEDGEDAGSAEVVLEGDAYKINYYDTRGALHTTEEFPGKGLRYVEDAAENWVQGIKVLNG